MTSWKEILIQKNATIHEAIKKIDSTSLQIVLVVDSKNRLLGTVTDGDIRRGILKGLPYEEPVVKVMNSSPITTVQNISKAEVLKMMQDSLVTRIPILDGNGQVVGVEILDVRLRRVDLPEEVSQSVYQRMNAERKSVANELRSQGFADSEKIRAVAEKERDIIITEAYKNAQKIKGEGDATAAKIYAEAFSKNQDFYDFFRSLEAYRKSFRGKDDILVLDPNSDFFKFLKSPNSK